MVFPTRGKFTDSGPLFDVMSPATSTIRLDPDLSPKIGLHIRADTNLTLPKAKSCWSKCIMYLHITILYVLLIILYSELKSTKRNIYDFNLAMLNLSAKHMELEMSCFREMSVLREALSGQGTRELARNKRQGDNQDEARAKRDVSQHQGSSLDNYSSETRARLRKRRAELDNTNRTSKSSFQFQARRGKQAAKRRSCKRSKATCFIHLKGPGIDSIPGDDGVISPWLIDQGPSNKFNFHSGNSIVEIGEDGLYLIYAQVYYLLKNETLNSFSIVLKEKCGSKETEISTCSTVGIEGRDVSCFTSLARPLNRGDCLLLRQRELNRKILLRKDQTYFGITLISRQSCVMEKRPKK